MGCSYFQHAKAQGNVIVHLVHENLLLGLLLFVVSLDLLRKAQELGVNHFHEGLSSLVVLFQIKLAQSTQAVKLGRLENFAKDLFAFTLLIVDLS